MIGLPRQLGKTSHNRSQHKGSCPACYDRKVTTRPLPLSRLLPFLPFLLKLSFLGSLALFIVDIFVYAGAIRNNVGISPLAVAGLLALGHLAVRWATRISLGERFSHTVLLAAVPVITLIALGTYFLEEKSFLYPNYLFVNFKMHYAALPPMALGLAGFGLVHSTKQFWIQHGRTFYLMASILAVLGTWILFLGDPLRYADLMSEDSWTENLTAVVFALAGVLSFSLLRFRTMFARHSWHLKTFVAACCLVGALFFLVAGEEISWGQRILNIESSEAVRNINRQGEINLHNTEWVWKYVYTAYQVIGLYGMLAWIARWLLEDILPKTGPWSRWLRLLVPEGYTFVSFGMIVLYVWLRGWHGPWKYQPWEEVSELLLAAGMVAHLLHVRWAWGQKSTSKTK